MISVAVSTRLVGILTTIQIHSHTFFDAIIAAITIMASTTTTTTNSISSNWAVGIASTNSLVAFTGKTNWSD